MHQNLVTFLEFHWKFERMELLINTITYIGHFGMKLSADYILLQTCTH